MCKFWNFWRFAKFHAQIWQVRKMASILVTAAHRAKISSILPPWGIKRVYVQLLELLQFQVGSQAERQVPWASCYEFVSFTLTWDHKNMEKNLHAKNYAYC